MSDSETGDAQLSPKNKLPAREECDANVSGEGLGG